MHPAVVWLDARTQETVDRLLEEKAGGKGIDAIRDKCGLPISTYFSAVKVREEDLRNPTLPYWI